MTAGNTSHVAVLLAVIAMPLFFAPYAAGDTDKDSDTTAIHIFDPKVHYDKIPDDVLLDRTDSKWLAQNVTDSKFEDKQNAVKMYALDDMGKNGWNEAMKRTVLLTHNFDVLSGEAGNGFELVALSKTLDRMQGVYSATEPEKRFHDWVMSTYTIPGTVHDIDARIDEIKDELGPDHVSQAVAAFDEQARHGNVPRDLIANDTAFWVITMAIAMCDYEPECDSAYIKKVRDEKIYERQLPNGSSTMETSHPIIDYFLPKAHAAWVSTEHLTTTIVRVYRCNYGSCSTINSTITTGQHTISESPPEITVLPGYTPIGHAIGTHAQEVYASSCDNRGRQNVYHSIAVQFRVGEPRWSDSNYNRMGCAVVSTVNISVANNPTAPWVWSLVGTSNALIQIR